MLLISGLFGSAAAAEPDQLRVMSFNIRYGAANDGDDHWDHRQNLVVRTIQDFEPDLLGTQETLGFQAKFLQQQLPDYTYVGTSRDANPDGEQCGILFRKNRFELEDSGQFWLSETSDVKFSKSWDSSLPRIATWAHLRERDGGAELLFVNTHFDHRGQVARLESARLLKSFIDSRPAELPVIVTGDFNCGEGSEPYQQLLQSTRLLDSLRCRVPEAAADEGTFNGFRGTTSGARIDWILVSPRFTVQQAEIVRTHDEGRYPSDHFPVTAILQRTDSKPASGTD